MIKFSKTNLIGNETGMSCKIGDIFQKNRGDYIYLTNIFEDIPELDPEKLIRASNLNTRTIASESGVSVNLRAGYSVPLNDSEVRIRFSNKHSAFAYLEGVVTYTLSIAKISRKLNKYWQENNYDKNVRKYCLVNELYEANDGILIFSKCSKTSVTLAHSQGLKIETFKSLLDAHVTISGGGSSVQTIDIQNTSQPIVKMLRLNKGKSGSLFRSI